MPGVSNGQQSRVLTSPSPSPSRSVPSKTSFVNSWGYGRPSTPDIRQETFAWKILPWKTIYAADIALTLVSIYILFGLPSSSTLSSYAYLILTPLLIVVLALPVFAAIAVPLSYVYDPPGKGTPEKYFVFNNAAFAQRWKGRKVPILTLYEAYFAGHVDLAVDPSTNQPYDLLTVLYQRHEYTRTVIEWSHLTFFFFKLIPELLRHTRAQDVEQVREHYDRGDDFYAAFLGPMMVYTSAIFNDEEDTLEQAQVNKLNLVANKIHLRRGDYHLDLGCGWGTLIAHFASQYGSDSTGVTLGKNQTEWANQKCVEAKVGNKARALCCDYRDTPDAASHNGKYSKITCLEMSEHVGVKYYSQFCEQIYRQLDDDGIFFLQIAGIRRAWQFEDFNWGLFMGKYIFPGADASCPLGWVINQLEGAGFEIRSEETVGIHYSATIKRWYDNWIKNQGTILPKYGQRWYRLWLWFLAWSVISPEQGSASCYQIVAHKNTRAFDRRQFLAERKYWKI